VLIWHLEEKSNQDRNASCLERRRWKQTQQTTALSGLLYEVIGCGCKRARDPASLVAT
jgi:hypothetical protein